MFKFPDWFQPGELVKTNRKLVLFKIDPQEYPIGFGTLVGYGDAVPQDRTFKIVARNERYPGVINDNICCVLLQDPETSHHFQAHWWNKRPPPL